MKKLLLVIDMQNDFIDGALGTKEAIAILPAVLGKIRAFDGEVFYTKDTHTQDYMETSEGRNLPVQHCIKGTDGWRLNADVEKLCIDKRATGVEKATFGAAALPGLIAERFPEGIDEIELIGLCTDICVISNALLLKAFFPGATIKVDAGCCAGATPQGHNNALEAMRACHISIV
jgi:nicotinamidase-related amidase